MIINNLEQHLSTRNYQEYDSSISLHSFHFHFIHFNFFIHGNPLRIILLLFTGSHAKIKPNNNLNIQYNPIYNNLRQKGKENDLSHSLAL